MISNKYHIVSMISASQCFFKHKNHEEKINKTPVICWAIAETEDPKFTNAIMRKIIGLYLDDKGNLSVCEDSEGFNGYLHQSLYQLTINN